MRSTSVVVAARAVALALAALVASCVPARAEETPTQTRAPTVGPVREFQFETLDGAELSRASLAGRTTVIGFVTSYDVPSQAQARFLANVERRFVPRVNVAVLVYEPPENLPLVQAFVRTLDLRYPAALVDPDTLAGRGPFPGMHHVPAVVVLDRDGRERWRHLGLVEQRELEAVLRSLEAPPR